MTNTVTSNNLKTLQDELAGATAEEILARAVALSGETVFASSLGQEDQVILDLIARADLGISVFTLDTGRLFPETYDLIAASEEKYGLKIEVTFPDAAEVEEMVAGEGVNLFRNSIAARKHCCRVRKVNPLRSRLAGAAGWVCGLRREQSPTRTELHAVEWDADNSMPKFNPLIDWTLEEVQGYLKENGVPYNPLHDRGFVSIGCACCTRAVRRGEDARAGRWWWEEPEHKECGLHAPNNNSNQGNKS